MDSSGFSTCRYTRWYDTKHGDVPMERHSWMKVHLMCGVKTNVVTSVEVSDGNGADSHICRLIQSVHELGIAPTFWEAQTA